MPISLTAKPLLIALLVIALGLVSCSDKQAEKAEPVQQDTLVGAEDTEKRTETIKMVVGGAVPEGPEELLPIDPATFKDWKVVWVENIKLLCPKDHAHVATVDQLAGAMRRAMVTGSNFLAIEPPADTVIVIYYTGPGHAKEVTGMNYPFVLGDTLHYWPPNNLGVPVMKYLIPKWQDIEPKHDFIRQGLITLLDGSGKNYHKWALNLYQQDRFIPLLELAADTTIDADDVGSPVALSASFVDFVVYSYGIVALGRLYRSQDDFDASVENLFGITTDSLQTQWTTLLGQVEQILKQSGQ